jgi:hypothetical protein
MTHKKLTMALVWFNVTLWGFSTVCNIYLHNELIAITTGSATICMALNAVLIKMLIKESK